MMKLFLFVALAALSALSLSAQKPQYKDLKHTYDYKDYVKQDGDPYQLFWTGLTSLSIPGGSQLLMRETGRGWVFLGTSIVLDVIASSAATKIEDLAVRDSDGNFVKDSNDRIQFTDDKAARNAFTTVLVAGLIDLGVRIWSCCDAVKVAKVRNMYYQNTRKYAIDTKMYPSVDFVSTPSGFQPTAGMTFALQF